MQSWSKTQLCIHDWIKHTLKMWKTSICSHLSVSKAVPVRGNLEFQPLCGTVALRRGPIQAFIQYIKYLMEQSSSQLTSFRNSSNSPLKT